MFKSLRLLIPMAPLLAMAIHGNASADSVWATQNDRDFWFTYSEPTLFQVRTYAQQHGMDSMLWLYTSDGTLIYSNDDWFGLDSWIETELSAGSYRLRAGVCCGNPDAWYGNGYELEFMTATVETTTTTSTTTTTEPETTTTTTEPETTTTTEITTTTVVEETTTTVEETTTTVPETTTTEISTTLPETIPPTTLPKPVETTVPPTTTTSTTTTSTTTTTTVVPATTVAPTSSVADTTEAPETTTAVEEVATTAVETPETTVPVEETVPTTEAPVVEEPIIDESLTDQQIVELLDPAKLEELSSDEIATLVESIADADLTDEQAEIIAQAMSNAPDAVKEEFESQVNIFSGQFDSYVPLNSKVTVGVRRVLVVATATVFALPAVATSTGTSRKVSD